MKTKLGLVILSSQESFLIEIDENVTTHSLADRISHSKFIEFTLKHDYPVRYAGDMQFISNKIMLKTEDIIGIMFEDNLE